MVFLQIFAGNHYMRPTNVLVLLPSVIVAHTEFICVCGNVGRLKYVGFCVHSHDPQACIMKE